MVFSCEYTEFPEFLHRSVEVKVFEWTVQTKRCLTSCVVWSQLVQTSKLYPFYPTLISAQEPTLSWYKLCEEGRSFYVRSFSLLLTDGGWSSNIILFSWLMAALMTACVSVSVVLSPAISLVLQSWDIRWIESSPSDS